MIDLTKVDTIVFDMDGTIADLYNFPNWLGHFKNKRRIFHKLDAMVDMTELYNALAKLPKHIKVVVVTWLPMHATKKYNKTCKADKKLWLNKFLPSVKKRYFLNYGTPKHELRRLSKNAIIFDDNLEVRKEWAKSGRIAFSEKGILNTLKLLTD